MVAITKLTPVESKAFKAYGYDPVDETLTIQFNNGKCTDYEGFTQSDWDKFSSAESKGSWYNRNVRGNSKYTPSSR